MRTRREQAAGEVIQGPWEALECGPPDSAVLREQLEVLAKEIADQLVGGHGSVVRWTASIADVELWRKAARRAGRILSVPVRTGVSDDGDKVWAVDESQLQVDVCSGRQFRRRRSVEADLPRHAFRGLATPPSCSIGPWTWGAIRCQQRVRGYPRRLFGALLVSRKVEAW